MAQAEERYGLWRNAERQQIVAAAKAVLLLIHQITDGLAEKAIRLEVELGQARGRIAEMEVELQARASVQSLRPNPDPIKNEEDRLRRKLKKHYLVLRKSRLDGTYTIAQALTGEPACHCMTLDEVTTRLESENFENEPLERYSAGPAVQNRKSASKEHLLSKLRQKMKEVPG